jgi:hypothetical protein
VLQRLLHERFEEYLAKTGGRGGPGEKIARDAVAAAFTYAQRVNAHALVAGRLPVPLHSHDVLHVATLLSSVAVSVAACEVCEVPC